jgi:hypothetical protein
MQRITPLLLSAAVLSVSALAGCHNDDHDTHHARSSDQSGTYYDRSQTAGTRVDRDTTTTYREGDVTGSGRIDSRTGATDTDLRTRNATPPVDNAAGAGVGGANEAGVTLPQPGTSGTRAPTQSANPDPHANTPRDATDAKVSDR